MSAYPNIKNYQQLLAEGNLGSQNMNFYKSDGTVATNSVALQCLSYYDQDHSQFFQTYGAVANYYERNRRINGAYGSTYYGECNWLNPINKFTEIREDQFYYLEDFIGAGPYTHLFIEGLTFFTRTRPNIYPDYYNWSFIDDPRSYYRVDILGAEYPYSHGGVRPDIIIQQFDDSNVTPHASDKLYLTYANTLGHGGWHEGYKMKIPCTLMLFNDKLYTPDYQPPIVVNPPDNDPINNNPPDQEPPNTPGDSPSTPISPYANFGGDTTDTGHSQNINQQVDYEFDQSNPRYVQEYFPWLGSWKNVFRWY
jgi:hypothetical protein